MRTVIYTQDLEPITIIDIPMGLLKYGEQCGKVMVPVYDTFNMRKYLDEADSPSICLTRTVTLEFHPIVAPSKHRTNIITTKNDELALLLDPSWLPGQQREINARDEDIEWLTKALTQAWRMLG